MDMDKIVNSKWFNAFDWLIRLLIINVLTILISILAGGIPLLIWYFKYQNIMILFISVLFILFGFIPCFITSFLVIKLYKDNVTKNVVKLFFIYLWDTFKRTYKINLFYTFFILIFIIAINYYWGLLSEDNFQNNFIGIISIVGFILIAFGIVSTLFSLIYLPMFVSYFRMSQINYLKLSFYFVFRHFIKTIYYLIIILIPILLTIVLGSVFKPLYMLYGISGPLYIIYLSSRELFWYLSNNLNDLKSDENLHN